MRIIGEPYCTVEASEQSESEIGKVILDFNAKFFLPSDWNSTVVFHRIFVTPLETLTDFMMYDHKARYIITKLLELLLVPTLDNIVDPVLDALIAVSSQITDWSLGLKANVTIDLAVRRLPPPPIYLSDVTHLCFANEDDEDDDEDYDSISDIISNLYFDYYDQDRDSTTTDDEDDDFEYDQVRFVPADESSIRALETVRVSTAEMECSVCLEDLTVETAATRLPCSHTFHGDCIVMWLNTSNFCPLCRFQLNS